MISFTFSLSFAIATGCMFAFHVMLILKNQSTLEMDILYNVNPFNLGSRSNWEQVFGEDWKTWFLPIAPKRTVNGITYPKRESFYE